MEAFMAVMLQTCLILFLFLTFIPFSSCQPQNIETFYPFDIPSPVPAPSVNNDPPILTPLPPPTSPLPPSPLPESSSNNRTIVKAVAVTAASTSVVAILFFLLIQKYVIARRRREKVGDQNSHPGRPPAVVPANEFTRFDWNLKGLIVDENGLDVIYWRKLEEGDKKNDFHKENFHSPRHEQEKTKIQELTLLREKSSSSHIKIQYEEDGLDQILTSRPPPASAALNTIEEKESPIQQSIIQSPPAAAAPPPPPPFQNKRGPAPPPPPLVLAKKNPAPPPPPPKAVGLATSLRPPPAAKGSSSEGKVEESSAAVGGGNGQLKLKPLHWDKVNKNVKHSMVWDKIDGGSFRFDGDLMEALFGYVATNRKSPTRNNNSSTRTSTNSQVILLDARKSQNTAIVLKSLALSREELLDALLEGKELKAETLEKLNRIAPTEEEQSQILDFDGDPTRLADAESFHYHILKAVPSAYIRLNALLFRSNCDSEILHLKKTLQTLELGCKELRTRGLLLKLLEAILKAGNRLNAGTSRGNAHAFNLTALRKLSDVKSVDGKTTLLHFVVEEVIRSEGKRCVINRNHSMSRSSSSSLTSENSTSKNEREKEYMTLGLPVVGGISAEFSNVKKAATIDYDAFARNCSALSVRTTEIRELVSQCAADRGGGFVKEMKDFLEAAEEELKVLRQEQINVMELVKVTTEYYQPEAVKQRGTHLLQLFVIIKDFLGMVDQACVEIARNLQRRRTSMTGIGSSSPKPQSVRSVRFPNLPEHFLIDKSRSTSSESDSDS